MDMKDLGTAIRDLRKERGHENQGKFALLVGIDAGNLSRIETGKQEATVNNLQKIADGLGVQVYEIVKRAEHIQEDEKEKAWMRMYKRLSPADRDAFLRMFGNTESKLKQQNNNNHA